MTYPKFITVDMHDFCLDALKYVPRISYLCVFFENYVRGYLKTYSSMEDTDYRYIPNNARYVMSSRLDEFFSPTRGCAPVVIQEWALVSIKYIGQHKNNYELRKDFLEAMLRRPNRQLVVSMYGNSTVGA